MQINFKNSTYIKLCAIGLTALFWAYKEYAFQHKIELNEKKFKNKRKQMLLSSNTIENIDIGRSEDVNNVAIRHIFPYKEFKQFLCDSSAEVIDITFGQLFYATSLMYVDDKTLRELIIYSICDEYLNQLHKSAQLKINNYVDSCIEIIRLKLPLKDDSIKYQHYKADNEIFSIGYSWSFSKLFEGYIKISNFISVLNYGFYREKIDDVDIYYRLTGKKNIMLMFGGIVGNIGSVQHMFEDFLDQYDIIYPVYPITNLPIDYNFNTNNDMIDYVDKINRFLQSKKINMFHVVGWSFGGFTSNVFLKKYPHYIVHSKFIAEGLITPFSCVTSHMLINEPLVKSFDRLSRHMQNKYYSAMVAYAFLFKLKNIKWASYTLLNFRNVQWTNESLNTCNTTLYFSKNDFLLPIDFHQHYIDSFSNATVVIDNGSHGYYLFSEKFKETLRNHFLKYKFKEITRNHSCSF